MKIQDIYLDNAAATPVLPALIEAYPQLLASCYPNPSAAHRSGTALARQIKAAADEVQQLLEIPRDQAITLWTSGGTEANNLAILGSLRRSGRMTEACSIATEHPSVREPLSILEKQGAPITWAKVDRQGRICLQSLARQLTSQTHLLSIALIQSETGVIQDLAAIRQLMDAYAPHALLHVDAVQAAGKIPIPWETAHIDMLSLSGHKFHGPCGVGALIARKPVRLEPLFAGGGQQESLRSGSLDGCGITAFCFALREVMQARQTAYARVRQCHSQCLQGIRDLAETQRLRITINSPEDGSPYILNFTMHGYQGAVLTRMLGEKGVMVATGSACASESNKPSRTLTAMGISAADAYGALRVSFGLQTTPLEIDLFHQTLTQAIKDY